MTEPANYKNPQPPVKSWVYINSDGSLSPMNIDNPIRGRKYAYLTHDHQLAWGGTIGECRTPTNFSTP